jgi:hypothetical protein
MFLGPCPTSPGTRKTQTYRAVLEAELGWQIQKQETLLALQWGQQAGLALPRPMLKQKLGGYAAFLTDCLTGLDVSNESFASEEICVGNACICSRWNGNRSICGGNQNSRTEVGIFCMDWHRVHLFNADSLPELCDTCCVPREDGRHFYLCRLCTKDLSELRPRLNEMKHSLLKENIHFIKWKTTGLTFGNGYKFNSI